MEATKEKRRLSKTTLIWIIAALIPILAFLLFEIFASNPKLSNGAVKYFSHPAKNILGTISSIFPFSVMEIMFIALGILLITYLTLSVIKTVKSDRRLPTAAKRLAALLLAIAYIYTAYLWLLGIDYRADSFSEKSGLTAEAVSTEDLYTVTAWFVTHASALAGTVRRDAGGHFAEPMDGENGYISRSTSVYDNIIAEYPCLACKSRRPKKMVIFSKIQSSMGFTGIYFPFTGESNINIDSPACLRPCTIAHELAHQRSVMSEQEANFLGIAAGISSGDTVYAYSGLLSGSIHLMNALYKADHGAWQELRRQITGPMLTDWEDNNFYWQSYKSPVTEASGNIYDSYLKANGQELGMQSYGACVDLLVAYYLPLTED